MRCHGFLIGVLSIVLPLQAQVSAIDLNEVSPAGDLLRLLTISAPQDRPALLNQFVREFPKHPATSWALHQIADTHIRSQAATEADSAADRILAADPDDLDLAFRMLKLAESKQDAHLTAKWSAQTEAIAKRLGGQPCARVQAATSHCEQSKELARQVLPYIQYLHFVEILKVKDPEQRLAALEAFLKDCPDSAYEQQARNMIFQIHFQTSDPAKIYQAALAYLKTADDNDDVLLLVAERYFQEGREPERTFRYATRALEVAYERRKPDDVDAAGFERQKETNIRRAHWLIGRLSADAGNYPLADQHLRAALPALKSDSPLRASALFYLGWANYKMGRMEDALKFNQMCVNIPGVHQDGARRNLEVIQAELKQ